MVLKIQVVGVQIVLQGRGGKAAEERRSRRTCGKRLRQVRVVVVDLQVHRRCARRLVRPAGQNVAARQTCAAGGGYVFCAAVEVALYGQTVWRGRLRIEAESAAANVPRVIRARAGGRDLPVTAGVFAVSTKVNTGRERGAEANARLFLHSVACRSQRVQPLSVSRGFGDDVDHAVYRIGSPQGATRSTDDLDPLDVRDQAVLHVPQNTAIERRVHRSTIDKHQQLVGEIGVETAGTDRPVMRIDLGYFQIVRQSQDFRNARGSGAADVIGRDHLNGRPRPAAAFAAPWRPK